MSQVHGRVAAIARVELSGSLDAGAYVLVLSNSSSAVIIPSNTETFAVSESIQNGSKDAVALLKSTATDILLIDAIVYNGTLDEITLVDGEVIALGSKSESIGKDKDNATGSLNRIVLGDVCDREQPSEDWSFSETPTPGAANAD